MYNLREDLPIRKKLPVEVFGLLLFFAVWQAICFLGDIPRSIFPAPLSVITSFPELLFNDGLVPNLLKSLKLNLLSLLEAVVLSLPIGFAIGFNKYLRAICERYIVAFRFLPLGGTIGLFILWFKIGDLMKIQFLAASIALYLIPAVLQRIKEVEQIYEQTLITLGASKWQTFRYVYLPAVVAKVVSDIINLAGISWSYITIAERVNMIGGGIGVVMYAAEKNSRTDKLFALLLLVALVAVIFDKLAIKIDKTLFRFKYSSETQGR